MNLKRWWLKEKGTYNSKNRESTCAKAKIGSLYIEPPEQREFVVMAKCVFYK